MANRRKYYDGGYDEPSNWPWCHRKRRPGWPRLCPVESAACGVLCGNGRG